MTASKGPRPRKPARREKVAHIRFSDDEMQAVEGAAQRAGLSVSGFMRSLSLEGAGVRPFMSRHDRAIMEMLLEDMRAVGGNLNQIDRTLNATRSVAGSDLTGAIDDARAIATIVAAELASMTKWAGVARRGEAS
jgi:hypothetical protein